MRTLIALYLAAQVIMTGAPRHPATAAPSPGSAAVYVNSAGSNSHSVSYTCTAGNVLHIVAWSDGNPGVLSLSDTAGVALHPIAQTAAVAAVLADWWALCAGGADTFTYAGGTADTSIAIAEYTRANTSTLVGSQKLDYQVSVADVVLSVTAPGSGELALGAAMDAEGHRFTTATSGWTARAPGGGGTYITLLDNLNAGPGAVAVDATVAGGPNGPTGVMGILR